MTKYKLSYRKGERRWRKKYKGRTYNFPLAADETKESSYRRTLIEWNRKKAEIDLAATEDHQATIRESWRPFLNRLRETQQKIIDDYGDTPQTRRIWGELERFFAVEIISASVHNGELVSDAVSIDDKGRETVVEDKGQEDELEHLLEQRVARLQDAYPQLPQAFYENTAARQPEPPSDAPPWEEDAADQVGDLQQLLRAFAGSLGSKASPQRVNNIQSDVNRYLNQLPSGACVSQALSGRRLGEYFDSV